MPKPAHETAPSPFGLDRIVFFSDAVIAIAITLLVLDIRAPEMAGQTALEITQRMLALWPKYLGYVVSFWVIALFWVAHHRCFRYIRKYNRRLIYLNFLFLMFIAFMPYPTGLLFSSPAAGAAVVLYAGTAACMGLSLAGLWIYAVRRRFVAADVSGVVVRDIRLNLLLPPLVFLISAAVALVNADIAMYVWLVLLPLYFLRRRTEMLLLGDEDH